MKVYTLHDELPPEIAEVKDGRIPEDGVEKDDDEVKEKKDDDAA